MIVKVKRSAIAWVILIATILAGCSIDRWVSVEPGEYVVTTRPGTINTPALTEIQKLEIDRSKHLIVFTPVDGPEIIASFVARDRAVWPSGCPTNINATRMEVLDIEGNVLTIESMTLSNPVLVRDCPPDPIRVILREDGPIGGGGGACTHLNQCIFFEQGATFSGVPTPLPHSLKGYELYSWYIEQEDEWYFTLITATNRLKTYKEITSVEKDRVVEEGWVKITVKEVDSLKDLLERLPKGEAVVWIDGTWLKHILGEGGNFAFPDRHVVDEIERHCRQLGLELHLAGQDG